MRSAEHPHMMSRFAVVLFATFVALTASGRADAPPTTRPQATPPPRPLAIHLTQQGIFPVAPLELDPFAYAPSTKPFTSAYPYPGAQWIYGVFPPQQYRGN